MATQLDHLLRCNQLARAARESGNTPFGALLVGPDGQVLIEQGNIELTEHKCTGHAETQALERASQRYDKDFLWGCALYTTVEPCAMCAGALYWANVGTLVYGLAERDLLVLTGANLINPTFDLPCREIFARGQKPITVIGPFPELAEAIAQVHRGFWG